MSATAQPQSHALADSRADAKKQLSRRVLVDALFLGGIADALLHNGPGLGLFLWMIVFAVVLHDLVRRRGERMTREQRGWLGAALCFTVFFAWRDSSDLGAYNFLSMLGALALLGATLSHVSLMRTILGQRLRDLALALARVVREGAIGIVPLTLSDSDLGAVTFGRGSRTRAILRATVLTLPLLLLFGALFSGADPLFGALLLPKIDFGAFFEHLVVFGFYTWVVGGWLRGALIDDRLRAMTKSPARPMLSLGSIDVTTILGAVTALFIAFLAVQVRWLFGGAQLVRATTGLGYAEYARHGFFELVFVSLFVLPLLLGTRAAIADKDVVAIRRHRQLAVTLLVLVGGVMASALGRMGLYVHYYGLSSDRLFATVFMVWLAIVFIWFGLTVLRGRSRDFVAGMTITGFLTMAAINLVNPETLVARVNIDRARSALQLADSDYTTSRDASQLRAVSVSPIDYEYLTRRLDGDAVPVVVEALLTPPVAPPTVLRRGPEVTARCLAVAKLLERWSGSRINGRERDWRQWNLGAWRAGKAVRERERQLREVTCLDAQGEAPFGDRDRRPSQPGEQKVSRPVGEAGATLGGSGGAM